MKTVEIEIAKFEVHALNQAAATLRWLVQKTGRGWSHPAVDARRCTADADRLAVLYYAARERFRLLHPAEVLTLGVPQRDAALLRRFIDIATATEGDGFGDTFATLARLAHRIDAHGRPFQPPRRERRSSLAESPRIEQC